MNENEIFKQLGAGIRFSSKLKIKDRTRPAASDPQITEKLNFFSTTPENRSILKRKNEVVDDDCPKKLKTKENKGNTRKQLRIFVQGTDVPDLCETVGDLETKFGVNSVCVENLTNIFGFSELTPIQMQAIPAMLHGREVLASAPTGSGKTLAFLIPVVTHLINLRYLKKSSKNKKKSKRKNVIRALILSPTRELAEQTYQECQKLIQLPGTTAENSDLNQLLNVRFLDKSLFAKFSDEKQVGPDIDLLISTPNRIIYLLNQSMLDLSTIEWLVVDESDKLFEDGKKDFSFREQLGQIYSACENPGIRRAMFSATFAHDVQRWCIMNMDNVLQITVGGKNTAAKSVEQELKYVGNEDGKLMALEEIIRKGFSPPALVFVQSKDRAKELFAELVYDGLRIDVIHGDRSAEERDRAIEGLRSGRTWLLICTEHMGRGMDFKGVNLVVNYDFPRSAVTYIHRVGRTGRAGQTGRAITMFTDDDRPLLRSIANVVKEAGCYVPEYMLKMKKLGKDQRRKVAKTQLKRKTIRTAPAEILNSGKAKKFKRKLKNENDSKTKKDS